MQLFTDCSKLRSMIQKVSVYTKLYSRDPHHAALYKAGPPVQFCHAVQKCKRPPAAFPSGSFQCTECNASMACCRSTSVLHQVVDINTQHRNHKKDGHPIKSYSFSSLGICLSYNLSGRWQPWPCIPELCPYGKSSIDNGASDPYEREPTIWMLMQLKGTAHMSLSICKLCTHSDCWLNGGTRTLRLLILPHPSQEVCDQLNGGLYENPTGSGRRVSYCPNCLSQMSKILSLSTQLNLRNSQLDKVPSSSRVGVVTYSIIT